MDNVQLAIAHIHFYVEDHVYWSNWFCQVMGFEQLTKQDAARFDYLLTGHGNTSVLFYQTLTQPLIIAISSPQNSTDIVANYLQKHPAGVIDVGFFVQDLEKILGNIDEAVSIAENSFNRWCKIVNPEGIFHTLIEQNLLIKDCQKFSNIFKPLGDSSDFYEGIDHVVLNVPVGRLEPNLDWYETVFGFERQQIFEIKTQYSGLFSQVLKHPSGVQIPVNQPSDPASQIQDFLTHNGGSGVQHIAFKMRSLTAAVTKLRSRGLNFLEVPRTYYQQRQINYPFFTDWEEWPTICQEQILIDVVQDPNHFLLQIFSQPIFEKPTFFLEFIERRNGAKGFGEGNFQALFEAIEQAQRQRQMLQSKLI